MPDKNATLALLATSVILPACAGISAEDRAYARQDYRLQFLDDRRVCEAGGGRLYLQAWGGQLDRDGIPRSRTPYYCQ